MSEIRAIAEEEPQAWHRAIKTWGPGIWKQCARLVKGPGAEDLYQEICTKLPHIAQRFLDKETKEKNPPEGQEARFQFYMLTATKCLCLDEYRKRQREMVRQNRYRDEKPTSTAPSDETLDYQDLAQKIEAQIEQLDLDGQVILRTYLEMGKGAYARRAAQLLNHGKTEKSIYSKFDRIRAKLLLALPAEYRELFKPSGNKPKRPSAEGGKK